MLKNITSDQNLQVRLVRQMKDFNRKEIFIFISFYKSNMKQQVILYWQVLCRSVRRLRKIGEVEQRKDKHWVREYFLKLCLILSKLLKRHRARRW